jgi:NAD(P)-dependent dehydrogenase (short-subunit alcohol dehydrogenase family)
MAGDDVFSLRGKVAVVTGAAGLLGRYHVTALAAAGADVALGDLDGATTASRARQAAEGIGVRAAGYALDVTDHASVTRFRDSVLAEFGRIDVLVNNAAVNDRVEDSGAPEGRGRFETFPLDAFRRSLDVNVAGVFACSQILGETMARQGSGSIVNVASTYAMVGPDPALYRRPDGTQALWKSPAYPASKGAVLSFTRYLAAYWGNEGVRVNALSPGGVENGQESWFVENYARRTPLGRMAGPEDYQGALVFLASDASRYMTGANLVVDGGFTAW